MRLLEILFMTLGGVWQGVRQDFNLLEIALVLTGIVAWRRGWRPQWPALPVIRRPWPAAIALTLGEVALRIALLPLLPMPVPVVADEFSHSLLADTILHGRAANPTHPFWPHFESLHIIQQPHYVSNYFPGHAIFLAAGRVLLNRPWAGVLAEDFAFLIALFWMLRGWMPSRWALFGLLLAAVRFSIGSYWVNAYHGGFLPAAAGALVAGAFPRLRRRIIGGSLPGSAGPTLALAAGLAVLAATRPFEGFCFSLPFLAILAWELRRNIQGLLRVGLPVLLLVGVTVVALGAYCKQITGSPFITAYNISQKTYGWPMALAWTSPAPIQHRHIEFQRYYEYEVSEREKIGGPLDFVEYLTFRLQEYWRFFLGPVLTIPLIMLGRVWRRRPMLLIGVSGGLFAVLLEGAASPHYLAPATAVIVAILVECCRCLQRSRLPVALPAVMVLVLTLRVGAQNLGLPYTQELNYQSWCCKVRGNMNKSRIEAELKKIPGKHVVFVKSKTDVMNLYQWIYNDADIDASQIVWARDLGEDRNVKLRAYYADRQSWLVDPNVEPASLTKP